MLLRSFHLVIQWDRLSPDVIGMPDIFVFKNALRRMNRNYVDLLT